MNLKDYTLVALKLDKAGRIVSSASALVSLALCLILSAPCRGHLWYHSISIFSLSSLWPLFYSHLHFLKYILFCASCCPCESAQKYWLLMTALTAWRVGFFVLFFFSLIPCSPSSEYPVYPIISVWLSLRIVFCISMLCLMSSFGSRTCFFSTCSLHLGDSDLVSSNAFLLFHDFFL